MEQTQITPEQALTLLDQATQPANVVKLTRADYCNIQVALNVLAESIKPKDIEVPVYTPPTPVAIT